MRELKFRLWNPERKVLTAGTELNTLLLTTDGDFVKEFKRRGMVWMQFIGIKDKTGKEIYEGDLVKIGDHKVPEVIIFGECDYDSGEHIAAIQSCFGSKDHRFSAIEAIDSFTLKRLEVVGNIYQNPELL